MGLSKSLVASTLVFMICMYTPSSSMSSPGAKTLKVGVPSKARFREFVSVNTEANGKVTARGFCVEVFEAAMRTLDYSFEYIQIGSGNGVDLNISDYDNAIHQIVLKKLDAVVGDFTITSKRSKEVQFAQPYLDSGLVAVVPMKDQHIISFGWAFTKPFTAQMWLLTVGFFISGGIVLYILERKNNPRFQGKPGEQFGNVLWFSFSTWFTNQDDIRTVMGRVVVVAWLFVIGILYSCYTANLSAILTASRLEPTLNDITDVVSSGVSIGYNSGSPVRDILVDEYGISKKRLVALHGDYYDAISSGRVGAIVDERPYMQSLVANNCHSLAFAGQTFTTLNWGFAFDLTNYQLVRNISVKILELSEKGELLALQQLRLPYYDSDCSKYSDQSGSSQLHVAHFWGLFAISGLVAAIVLLFYMVHWKWNSSRVASSTPPPAGSSGPNSPQEDSNSPQEGSSDQGGGSCSPDQVYRRSLELTKNIQFQRRTKSLGNSMLPFHGI